MTHILVTVAEGVRMLEQPRYTINKLIAAGLLTPVGDRGRGKTVLIPLAQVERLKRRGAAKGGQ